MLNDRFPMTEVESDVPTKLKPSIWDPHTDIYIRKKIYTRSLPYALRTKTLHKHIFSPVSFLWKKTLLAVHITINLNSNNIRIWIQTIFVIEFIHHFKYWNLVCLSSSPLHDVFIDEFPLWVLYCIPKFICGSKPSSRYLQFKNHPSSLAKR